MYTSDISHPPNGRLLLLFARPAVTFPAAEHHAPRPVSTYTAWGKEVNLSEIGPSSQSVKTVLQTEFQSVKTVLQTNSQSMKTVLQTERQSVKTVLRTVPVFEDSAQDWVPVHENGAPDWFPVRDNSAPDWVPVGEDSALGWVSVHEDCAPDWVLVREDRQSSYNNNWVVHKMRQWQENKVTERERWKATNHWDLVTWWQRQDGDRSDSDSLHGIQTRLDASTPSTALCRRACFVERTHYIKWRSVNQSSSQTTLDAPPVGSDQSRSRIRSHVTSSLNLTQTRCHLTADIC